MAAALDSMPMAGVRPGLDRLTLARRLARQDRRLLIDYVRFYMAGAFGGPVSRPSTALPAVETLGLAQAHDHIRQTVGPWSEGPALELLRSHTAQVAKQLATHETGKYALFIAGDSTLGELVYALVRALRPRAVVETGVATGTTTAYALAGLADNSHGHLHSIDLPSTFMLGLGQVAVMVPGSLRDRWTYHWGSAGRLLPPLLDRVRGNLDLFIHDSDHRYKPMLWELDQGWSAMTPGGWLVADDAQFHSAVYDLGRARGVRPVFVRQDVKSAPGCVNQADNWGLTGLLATA